MVMVTGNGHSSTKPQKVVLAYSGGLDTSVAIRWLQETKGLDVVTLTLDLGQDGADLQSIAAKAQNLGATAVHTLDVKQDFADQFVKYAIWANALYGGKYPLATALGRPLIAQKLVEVAQQEGATFIAHGCTAKGNDQVRIEVTAQSLDPHLTTIAPMREWLYTRDEAVAYANEHAIPVPVKKGQAFSVDENLWGRSVESGPIEDATKAPPEAAYAWTTSPKTSPEDPLTVTISFEHGVPTALGGQSLPLWKLIAKLNEVAGAHGIGRIDQVEDRLVGIKSREIYEAPAAVTLLTAHKELESLVLAKDVLQFKPTVEAKFAELTYNGLWYSPLMEALKTFLATTQQRVTGTVALELYKGNLTVQSRESPNSLYDAALATYGQGDAYDHTAAAGFIKIWGLPLSVWTKSQQSPKDHENDDVPPIQTTH